MLVNLHYLLVIGLVLGSRLVFALVFTLVFAWYLLVLVVVFFAELGHNLCPMMRSTKVRPHLGYVDAAPAPGKDHPLSQDIASHLPIILFLLASGLLHSWLLSRRKGVSA